MPAATENRQLALISSLTRLVVRRPVAAFLVMLYGIAWGVFLPVILQARGLLALPIDLTEGFAFDVVVATASILGVALPAFLVTAATSGKAGVRDLLGRCLRWRVGIGWYLIALFGLLAVTVLAGSVLSDPAPLGVLTERWPLLFTLFLPEVLLPFLTIQLFEEAGWTGFMQHTLQERRGPLVASILVAPAFVLQHLPILLMDAGVGLASLIVVGALVAVSVFFRIVIMWLYNGSGRSVPIAALFHSAYNSAWGTGDHRFTGELISGPAATLIPIGVVAVVAVTVAVLSRGRLAYKPARRSTTEAGGAAHRVSVESGRSFVRSLRIGPLLVAVAVCVLFALFGTALVGESLGSWYGALDKPWFLIPLWAFGIVGAIYYVLFAIVLYRILAHVDDRRGRVTSLVLTVTVLFLNVLWNIGFFGLQSTLAGFLGVAAFLIPVTALVVALRSQERFSAALVAVYWVWVLYDLAWTFALWRLNS